MYNIVTIDGLSGAGKGTLAKILAKDLGWNYLDSGALYRVIAIFLENLGIDIVNLQENQVDGQLINQIKSAQISFVDEKIYLNNQEISYKVRLETTANLASIIANFSAIRDALWDWQQSYSGKGNLIADGRDMGTVVFPMAKVKFYLIAKVSLRAERRFNQLIEKGVCVSLDSIVEEIKARDYRDINRSISPLKPAEDAIVIDTGDFDIDQLVDFAKNFLNKNGLIGLP